MTDTTSKDVEPVPASAVPAPMTDAEMFEGLADFDERDLVVPTIKLDHQEGVFVDTLTNQNFDTLDCAVLGLVKGRTMWDKEVKEDTPPLCRSLNFDVGYPGKDFPWGDSGFTRPAEVEGVTLSCDDCKFKEWGTHPTRERVPWCSEQHTYVIARPVYDEGDGSIIEWAPALITFQGSGITPSRKYLTSFMQRRVPTFTTMTQITLDHNKRGTVKYVVPVFTALDEPVIDTSFHEQFVRQFRASRSFLHAPRGSDSEGDGADSSSSTPAGGTTSPDTPGASSGATVEPEREAPAGDEMPF